MEKGSARVNSHAQEHKIKTMCPARGPFLERPGNLTGPKTDFDIKVSRKLGRVMTSDEVHFVSLADNFTVNFSNLLKLPSGVKKQNSLTGPVITGSFEKRAPGLEPVTLDPETSAQTTPPFRILKVVLLPSKMICNTEWLI